MLNLYTPVGSNAEQKRLSIILYFTHLYSYYKYYGQNIFVYIHSNMILLCFYSLLHYDTR